MCQKENTIWDRSDEEELDRICWLTKHKKICKNVLLVFPPGATQLIANVYFTALYRALASLHTRLLDHIQRRATVGRTPLYE